MGTMGPGMWSPPSERGMAAVMEVENALCYSQRGLSMSINCSLACCTPAALER